MGVKLFELTAACQKILQQRLTPSLSATPSTPRPTTPNHYSLGRHFSSAGSAAPQANYPGGPSFSSSSLSCTVAGSTLGPAGAAIGTGHSSLAGYNGALTGSAHNLHSTANLNSNGALAARGDYY